MVYWNTRIWDHEVKSVIGRFKIGFRRPFSHIPELKAQNRSQEAFFHTPQSSAGALHLAGTCREGILDGFKE